MKILKDWFSIDAPAGWTGALVRSLNVAVVAFIVLQAKEYYDAHAFDTAANSVDSLLVSSGVFILSAFTRRKT